MFQFFLQIGIDNTVCYYFQIKLTEIWKVLIFKLTNSIRKLKLTLINRLKTHDAGNLAPRGFNETRFDLMNKNTT